jgi:hypothetical protein
MKVLMIDQLERRRVLSNPALVMITPDRVLEIQGTMGDDVIRIVPKSVNRAARIQVSVNGNKSQYSSKSFDRIRIDAREGDDKVLID